MAKASLVVRRHRPWKDLCLGLVALAALGWAAFWIYQSGLVSAGAERDALAAERTELKLVNGRLTEANAALRERLAMLERAEQVQRQANAEVSGSLRALQDEILSLKEELAFYRGIVESSRKASGLTVQSFRVQPEPVEGSYQYRLVLTQVLKSDKVVEGTVTLAVSGEQAGEARVLSLAELSHGDPEGIKFQFKYFQKIEGRMSLPSGFVPRRVDVRITASGKAQNRIEKSFDWPRRLG